MQAIAGIDSLDALLKYLCSEDRLTCTVPFNAHIMSGDADPAVYAVFVEPVGLMLDDPEEYTKRTEFGQAEYDRSANAAGLEDRYRCGQKHLGSTGNDLFYGQWVIHPR